MTQQGPGGLSDKDQQDIAAMKGPAQQGWRYSMFFGVMYGNIPVGIIAVVVLGLVWAITRVLH
jgi:hypothetical protein